MMITKTSTKTKRTTRKKKVFQFILEKRYKVHWTNLTRKVTSTGMVLNSTPKFVCMMDEHINASIIIPIDKIIDSKRL